MISSHIQRQDAAERLRRAREVAGYGTATDAAAAMGVKIPTYINHENATAGLTRNGERYARFFRVDYEWLMTGRGAMRPASAEIAVPIDGFVGAGANVDLIERAAGDAPLGHVAFPTDGGLGALIVKGESQYPRLLDGEAVIYCRASELPSALEDRLAIVQTLAGERLIKTLRRAGDRWTLESHNAKALHGVELLGAWRVVAIVLAGAKFDGILKGAAK